MRNDVSFPPDPNAPQDDGGGGGTPANRNGRGPSPQASHARHTYPTQPPGPTHPHKPDRAHSLDKTRDKPATGPIYETPEDRGGIDSTTLSIVVVAIVAVVLLVIFWTVFRTADKPKKQAPDDVPNATIIDDAPLPEDPAKVKPTP